jgi:hypothetical protein
VAVRGGGPQIGGRTGPSEKIIDMLAASSM